MVKNSPPRAPAGLSDESRRIWKRITSEFDLGDSGGQLTLEAGLRALDRCERCRKIIDEAGEQVEDRFGQMKPHPLLAAERDARAQYMAALRALNLDVSSDQTGGRAPSDGRTGASRGAESKDSTGTLRRIY